MEKINKLKELKVSEINFKVIHEIISKYNQIAEIPRGKTGSASFEQLFSPPFKRLLEKDDRTKKRVLEKIAISTKLTEENVEKYLYYCGDTYIPLIIKKYINADINKMELLRSKTQEIVLKKFKRYCVD